MADREKDEIGALVYFQAFPDMGIYALETPQFRVEKSKSEVKVKFHKDNRLRRLLRLKTSYQTTSDQLQEFKDLKILQEFEVPWDKLEWVVRVKNETWNSRDKRNRRIRMFANDLITFVSEQYEERLSRLEGDDSCEELERDGYDKPWNDTTPDNH